MKKGNLIIAVLTTLVVIGAGFGYWKYSSNRNAIAKEAQRRNHINLVQVNFVENEGEVSKAEMNAQFPGLLDGNDTKKEECDEKEEYLKLDEKDSRDMSKAELQRAMDLHSKCAYTFYYSRVTAAAEFNRKISELFGFVPKQELSKAGDLVKQIAENWRNIYDVENELLTISENSINSKFGYWEAELEYSNNKSTLTTRNETFDKLNNEGDARNKKRDELENQVKAMKSTRTDLLKQFKETSLY